MTTTLTPRKSAERGRSRTDWLDSRHTFSFDTYHDHLTASAFAVIPNGQDGFSLFDYPILKCWPQIRWKEGLPEQKVRGKLLPI